MRRNFIRVICILCLLLSGVILFAQSQSQSQPQSSVSDEEMKKQYLAEIKERIAGREDEPAERIFHNIEILRGKSSSRLPPMMNALTGLLGVNCTYCHIPDHWEEDNKPAKRIARQHFKMIEQINDEFFNGENKVSCWTCHHGKPKAELVPSEN